MKKENIFNLINQKSFHDSRVEEFSINNKNNNMKIILILGDYFDDNSIYTIKYSKIIKYDFKISNKYQFTLEVDYSKLSLKNNKFKHKIYLHGKKFIKIKCRKIELQITQNSGT